MFEPELLLLLSEGIAGVGVGSDARHFAELGRDCPLCRSREIDEVRRGTAIRNQQVAFSRRQL